jgi:glycosyltransferase involved in cell wall biosynthesis
MYTDSSLPRHSKKHIVVVVKGWPRLSETFIAQELLGLQHQGHHITVAAISRGKKLDSQGINVSNIPVIYLPKNPLAHPLKLIRAWYHCHKKKGLKDAISLVRQHSFKKGYKRLCQAACLVASIPKNTDVLYAHFIHDAATIAWLAGTINETPFAISAHAKDIYTTPPKDLQHKIEACAFVATCTKANVAYLHRIAPSFKEKIHLVYHGLDKNRLTIPPQQHSSNGHALRLLSVGRLVPKKGVGDILEALRLLPSSLAWHFTHLGGGALQQSLKQQAYTLGIQDKVSFLGAVPHEMVMHQMRTADIFIMNSQIDTDGDRDGLPNVLMEALMHGLLCIATNVSAIPELIIHEQTGILVPPNNPKALAKAIIDIAPQEHFRRTLAHQGRTKVSQEFQFSHHLERLLTLFDTIS